MSSKNVSSNLESVLPAGAWSSVGLASVSFRIRIWKTDPGVETCENTDQMACTDNLYVVVCRRSFDPRRSGVLSPVDSGLFRKHRSGTLRAVAEAGLTSPRIQALRHRPWEALSTPKLLSVFQVLLHL